MEKKGAKQDNKLLEYEHITLFDYSVNRKKTDSEYLN